MYNQLYLWANNNFKLLCICILVVVFAMVFISALMKHRRRMHICWISLFIVYLLMLAFITVISHSDIHQSVVVGRLRFHYIFISKPDTGLPWENIANVILFIPMGVFLYGLVAGRIHWYGCLIVTALCSAAIELSQYMLQCVFSDINDFMNNLLGSVMGYILCCGIFNGVHYLVLHSFGTDTHDLVNKL